MLRLGVYRYIGGRKRHEQIHSLAGTLQEVHRFHSKDAQMTFFVAKNRLISIECLEGSSHTSSRGRCLEASATTL